MSLAAILGFVQTFYALYPFTWEQTVLIAGMIWGAFQAIKNKQWSKVEKIIYEQALPLADETFLSNEERRDEVVKQAWRKMPVFIKAIATESQVEKMVDYIYVTQVKPKIRLAKEKSESERLIKEKPETSIFED